MEEMVRGDGAGQMEAIGQAYLDVGMRLFENEGYERCVSCLIKAFEAGHEKDAILDFLYQCFITPNEAEFQKNYSENCMEITQFPYGKCVLDFVPVSETKFYIFDTEQQKFEGIFELAEEPVRGREDAFHSILYTDIWDIRDMIPNLEEKKWDTVYVLLNEMEAKFLSFLKLPKFKELYLENAVVFCDSEIMHAFFEQYEEYYLPRKLVGVRLGLYAKLIQELHEKRIHSKNERRNVFLSICIPSYNRGSQALENVRHILACPYDSEIEVIVSNNGSVKDVEGYHAIRDMDDVRVSYFEFEANQGYASNVIKVLEMATGRYAVLVSDEDRIILENMGEYLTYLKAHPDGGVFLECGVGGNLIPKIEGGDIRCRAGLDAIRGAMNLNYLTGVTYHMGLLREAHAFGIVSGMRGNKLLEAYVHIVFGVIAAKYMDFYEVDLLLWDARRTENPEEGRGLRRPMSYMLPESRVDQLEAALEVLWKGLCVKGTDFIHMFSERCHKAYFLLRIAYVKFESYRRLYSWEEICLYVYRKNREYTEDFPVVMNEDGKAWLRQEMQRLFLESLSHEWILSLEPERRQGRERLYELIRMEAEGQGRGAVTMGADGHLLASLNGLTAELQEMERDAISDLGSEIDAGCSILHLYEIYWDWKRTHRETNVPEWDA